MKEFLEGGVYYEEWFASLRQKKLLWEWRSLVGEFDQKLSFFEERVRDSIWSYNNRTLQRLFLIGDLVKARLGEEIENFEAEAGTENDLRQIIDEFFDHRILITPRLRKFLQAHTKGGKNQEWLEKNFPGLEDEISSALSDLELVEWRKKRKAEES